MIHNHLFTKHFMFVTSFVITISVKGAQADVTTSATPTTTLQRSTTADAFSSQTQGLTKTKIKREDLVTASNTLTAAVKSYDPPPEFYRWVEWLTTKLSFGF